MLWRYPGRWSAAASLRPKRLAASRCCAFSATAHCTGLRSLFGEPSISISGTRRNSPSRRIRWSLVSSSSSSGPPATSNVLSSSSKSRLLRSVADETLRKDEAYAAITAGGKRYEVHVAHASGTADNPMSNAAIEAKFLANATPVIGRERAERANAFVLSLEKQPDIRELVTLLA